METQKSFSIFYSTTLLFHCLQTLKQKNTQKPKVAIHIQFSFKAFWDNILTFKNIFIIRSVWKPQEILLFPHIMQWTNSFNQNKQYFFPKNKHYYSLLQMKGYSMEGFSQLPKITEEIGRFLNPDFESE